MAYALKRLGVKSVVALSIGLGAWTSVAAQSLTWLGTLGGNTSDAIAVSDNGVVVGRAWDAQGRGRAYRWTPETGMRDLGTLGGAGSRARAVSRDGTVVAGWAENADSKQRPFIWRLSQGTMQELPTGDGGQYTGHVVNALSADNAIIVGNSPVSGPWVATRWTGSVRESLGTTGGYESYAWAVSANGQVVVGWTRSSKQRKVAYRWVEGQGMIELGTPFTFWSESEAFDVSDDGQVVVGEATSNLFTQPVGWVWTPSTGFRLIGTLRGFSSQARGISGDGRIVVGNSDGSVFRWTQERGMEDLNEVYWHLLRDGSYMTAVYDISRNGRYIVGQGYNAQTGRFEAFLLDTQGDYQCEPPNPADVNRDGFVDDADLLQVLFNFGWQRCP